MALVNCSECGKQISDKAAACPQCGAPVHGTSVAPQRPAGQPRKKSSHIGCLPTLIVIFVTLWLVAKCTGYDYSASNAGQSYDPGNDPACRKSLKCWGQANELRAAVVCRVPIEREAKYQSEWTDGIGKPRFESFAWGDENKGTLKYFGEAVKFQNGFGAWQNMVYTCEYDPASKRALSVLVLPRN